MSQLFQYKTPFVAATTATTIDQSKCTFLITTISKQYPQNGLWHITHYKEPTTDLIQLTVPVNSQLKNTYWVNQCEYNYIADELDKLEAQLSASTPAVLRV